MSRKLVERFDLLQVIYEAVLGGDEEVLVGSVAGGGRWVVVVQLVLHLTLLVQVRWPCWYVRSQGKECALRWGESK